MIFETHAHYDDDAFDQDRDELLGQLPERGIGRVVNIGSSLAACRQTIGLMEQYPYIYGALGIHPTDSGELNEESFAWLREQFSLDKCVAVGEIGLDYYWKEPNADIQKKWFRRQLVTAREVRLPVVVHSREAAKDTLDILTEEKAGEIGGVMHCYSYTKEMARQILDMGLYFGIGGVVTFKNARKLKETVAYIPMESIVIETDSPYLSPEPGRGKRNSSLNLPYIITAIAQIKGLSEEEVELITWDNALRLYNMEVSHDS